jgi:3-dehydroquinate dehydratase-1
VEKKKLLEIKEEKGNKRNIRCKRGRKMKKFSRPAIVGTITKDVKESALSGKRDGADILELRLDLLMKNTPEFEKYLKGDFKSPKLSLQFKKWIKDAKPAGLPIIGTLRSKAEGGVFEGDENARFELIKTVIENVDYIDIERESSKKKIYECRNIAKKSGTKIIISSHFFDKKDVPSSKKLKRILKKSFERSADIAKVAFMPDGKEDLLKVYRVALENKMPDICLIAMGDFGKQTRILAPFFGSSLTYGYIDEAAAPGQLSVAQIKRGFRLFGIKNGEKN